jgi:hypothetical protein
VERAPLVLRGQNRTGKEPTMPTTKQPPRPSTAQSPVRRHPAAERVCAILDLAAERSDRDEPILDYPELTALLERSTAARRIAERRGKP